MKAMIAMLVWLLGLPVMASEWLPQTWGLHTMSYHFDGKQPEGSRGWNNNNLGIYARYDFGLTGGTFENSLYKRTWYVGWTFEKLLSMSIVDIDLFVGAGTGYDKVVDGEGDRKVVRCESVCRVVHVKDIIVPMLVPSVPLPLTDTLKARLSTSWTQASGWWVHLSVENRF
jgi:hypothetical protein